MIKILNNININAFKISAIYKSQENKNVIEKTNYIQDYPEESTSTIFINSYQNKATKKEIIEALEAIIQSNERCYQIDTKSFEIEEFNEHEIIETIIYLNEKFNGKRYSLKTKKEHNDVNHSILTKLKSPKFSEHEIIVEAINKTKEMQDMPNNILTIDKFVDIATKIVKSNPLLKLTTLSHEQLKKNQMNLILGVNSGSYQSAKVLIIEYKGNPKSTHKTTLVGKGIIFDSGGYNLKTPGKYMLDMKYDMSGGAIALNTIDAIAKLQIKTNFSIVVPLTDNLVDDKAQLPESIWKSMDGRTVEITNTDAEGRLILADGIAYAVKKLNSTRIIDISTLTGAILYALGNKYTGVWTSDENDWNIFSQAAKEASELVWRMPLDEIYIQNLTKETFADTHSCSNKEHSDSNIAAAWLHQFAKDRKYIHLDIAGTADVDSQGQAPMIKTLIKFIRHAN